MRAGVLRVEEQSGFDAVPNDQAVQPIAEVFPEALEVLVGEVGPQPPQGLAPVGEGLRLGLGGRSDTRFELVPSLGRELEAAAASREASRGAEGIACLAQFVELDLQPPQVVEAGLAVGEVLERPAIQRGRGKEEVLEHRLERAATLVERPVLGKAADGVPGRYLGNCHADKIRARAADFGAISGGLITATRARRGRACPTLRGG